MLGTRNADELNKGVSKLSPIQRFIFDYGLFLLDWNDFDVVLEVLIWHLRTKVLNERISYSRNYRDVNSMQVREKRSELRYLLRYAKRNDVIEAIDKVYDVADRNEWIHGKIFYFPMSLLDDRVIRFNPDKPERRSPRRETVPLDSSAFEDFREAYNEFLTVINQAFDFEGTWCLDYLYSVVGEHKGESS